MESNEFVSDFVVFRSYAQYVEKEHRRETYEEIVQRVYDMHYERYSEQYANSKWFRNNFDTTMQMILDKKILPSMRSMQFAGKAITKNNIRMFNCSFSHMKSIKAMADFFYILLCGTGTGASIQGHHVSEIPPLRNNKNKVRKTYVIRDSIEGWADAFMDLLLSYDANSMYSVEFDYSQIRPKGAIIKSSNAYAPGPGPLKKALDAVDAYLLNIVESGRVKYSPKDVFHILCLMADCVISGGIRRAATIFLFSAYDKEMLTVKTDPSWYKENPHYSRANISAVLVRNNANSTEQYNTLMKMLQDGKSGEPGIFWTDDTEVGTNPCGEIGLNDRQFCNLTTVNVSDISDMSEFHERVAAATFLGTLQAGYMEFPHISKGWLNYTYNEALLGVSLTGICDNPLFYTLTKELQFAVSTAAKQAVKINKRAASWVGIPPAARITCIKPEGTSSLVLGCSSGIHPRFSNKTYVKNIRIADTDPLVEYVRSVSPNLLEVDVHAPNTFVMPLIVEPRPQALTDAEDTWLKMFDRIQFYYKHWILPASKTKDLTHNVSATMYMPEDIDWNQDILLKNNRSYQSLAFFPLSGAVYQQAPLEKVSDTRLAEIKGLLEFVKLSNIREYKNNTNLMSELACAGGSCEII